MNITISIEEKINLKMVTHKKMLSNDETIALNLFCKGFYIEPNAGLGYYAITVIDVHLLDIETVVNIINL